RAIVAVDVGDPTKECGVHAVTSIAIVYERPGHGLGVDRQIGGGGVDGIGEHLVPAGEELLVETYEIHPGGTGGRREGIGEGDVFESSVVAAPTLIETGDGSVPLLQPGDPSGGGVSAGFFDIDWLVGEADALKRWMVSDGSDERRHEALEKRLAFRRVEAVLQEALAVFLQLRILLQHPFG